MGDYILPEAREEEVDCSEFTQALICERLDGIFKNHLPRLRRIYDFYAGKQQHRPEHIVPMIVTEWIELCQQASLVDEFLPEKDLPYAFRLGKAIVPDESSAARHMELEFV